MGWGRFCWRSGWDRWDRFGGVGVLWLAAVAVVLTVLVTVIIEEGGFEVQDAAADALDVTPDGQVVPAVLGAGEQVARREAAEDGGGHLEVVGSLVLVSPNDGAGGRRRAGACDH